MIAIGMIAFFVFCAIVDISVLISNAARLCVIAIIVTLLLLIFSKK